MKLEPVPKLIHYIATVWAPESFVVSFKLETDPELLLPKSKQALTTYKHQIVVANLLKERKRQVTIVRSNWDVLELHVDNHQCAEIEEPLVKHLVEYHEQFINTK